MKQLKSGYEVMKFFNTAGPVRVADHYALDPLSRINLKQVMTLIHQQKHFMLHAPRQTGKTSMLLTLKEKINREGQYQCVYINVESGQTAREDVTLAMRSILFELRHSLKNQFGEDPIGETPEEIIHEAGPHSALRKALSMLARNSKKPIVLLIDEIDALIGDALISTLRQLRTGYIDRPEGFPMSVVLCGVRDIRDYRIHASSEKEPITGGSAFNIKARSLRMGNFDQDETFALLQQHTDETGQSFTNEAKAAIFEASQGQPWLVNSIAYEITFEMEANQDPSIVLTEEMVRQAIETLILRRETHIDQLTDKLREPRVHRVIAPILAGDEVSADISQEDADYVRDLGLIDSGSKLKIANPIYKEVIPRTLTFATQISMTQEQKWYSHPDGRLNMDKLLSAFQEFFPEHSEAWVGRFQYNESGPQLLLQAFLQRVVNGGGRIDREYGLGRGRTDLMVSLPHGEDRQKIVLELKLRKGKRETTIEKALPQITSYMDRCGTKEGHLIIFDRGNDPWEVKIFKESREYNGQTVQVWGM